MLRCRLLRACVALLPVAVLAAACTGDRCDPSFGDGGCFDLSLPSYSTLLDAGSALLIERDATGHEVGHRGIFVRREVSTFVAFDASCPKDHDVQLRAEDRDGIVLTCPACSSRFETVYGQPLEGSSTGCSLYQYTTHYDGGYLLEIYF